MKENHSAARRWRSILACPSLALHYQNTSPLLERAYLRRLGLSRAQTVRFIDLMCEHGCLEEGAEALLCRVAGSRPMLSAALALLEGEPWPEPKEEV